MKKKLFAIIMVMIMCLQPVLVWAAEGEEAIVASEQLSGENGSEEVKTDIPNESCYKPEQKFGYDSFIIDGTCEGVKVLVDGAELSKGEAGSTAGVALEKGVRLVLEKGYDLKQYKLVCGEKYNCKASVSKQSEPENEENIPAAVNAEITAEGDLQAEGQAVSADNRITKTEDGYLLKFEKKDFGHSEKEQTYWLLLEIEKIESDSTEEPEPTGEPDPTEEPEPTGEPDPTEEPEPTKEPDPTPTPADDEKLSPPPEPTPAPKEETTMEFMVSVSWNDEKNQDGIRPSEVKIQLYANDKEKGEPVVLNADNNWKYIFKELPVKETEAGENNISYTVKSIAVPGGYSEAAASTADETKITYNHAPEKITIKAKNVWDDKNNQDGIRSSEVKIQLYADGKASGNAVALNAANGWSYSFKDLNKNAAGKAIAYTIKEVTVPTGYKAAYSTSSDGTLVVTNSHTPETISVTITVKWDDDNNKTKVRPSEVKIQLYANGQKQGSETTVKSSASWKYTYKDLPKYKDGKQITYTVKETSVSDKYIAEVNGYTITNVLKTKVAAKTGDSANLAMWTSLMAVSVILICGTVAYKGRKGAI